MIIKTLVENKTVSQEYGSEHGLSLYLELKNHKILFDTGASDLFLKNAEKLEVNIVDIDFLVISHGHNDHGGGLKTFLQANSAANVFLNEQAFNQHYALRKTGNYESIGIDEKLQRNDRFIFTSDQYFIAEGIWLFSNIMPKVPQPKSNSDLFTENDGQIVADNFRHEQNLVVEEDGKILLITGCAHNGIINILEHFCALTGRMPDYLIGGFHLSSPSGGREDAETIERIGEYLLKTKAKTYTCHCTGTAAYETLKSIMGDSVDYLATGSKIII